MDKTIAHLGVAILTALALLLSPQSGVARADTPVEASRPPGAMKPDLSPEGLLNPDGTLQLDGDFSGSLDLSGWDVQIDPQLGPVFNQPQTTAGAPLAVVSPGSWSDLGGGGGPALNGDVNALAVVGSNVYVGGNFFDVDNIPEADYIAMWNGTTWSAVGGGTNGEPPLTGSVYALAASSTGLLYAGGYFNWANNGATSVPQAARIAKWDGSNWSGLGSNGSGGGAIGNGTVHALAVDGSGNVYAGGTFTNVNNAGSVLEAGDYVAKWNGTQWSALGSNGSGGGSITANVNALAASGTDVYVAGDFDDVNNGGSPLLAADHVAKWNGSTWSALGGADTGEGSVESFVQAVAVSGSDVYVGGWFAHVHDGATVVNTARYLAKWDGEHWSGLGNNGAGGGALNSAALSIAVSGSNVYVGGQFTNVNNGGDVLGEADYIAKWDGAAWSALGDDGGGDGSLSDQPVYAVVLSGSDVIAGGMFTRVNDGGTLISHAAYVARWTGSHWAAMGPVQGSINDKVQAIAVDGSDVYVGGDFQSVSNAGATVPGAAYIAKWNKSTGWSALGGDAWGGPAVTGTVEAIAVAGSNVYVGGSFWGVYNGATEIHEACHIAMWNGASWSALGSDGSGGCSLNARVKALAVSGTDLFVGGWFTDVKSGAEVLNAADYVARWNGGGWHALSSNGVGEGSLNSAVMALAASGSDLYVGGDFIDVDNGGSTLGAADYIARWDGSNWWALGGNGVGGGSLIGDVNAIEVSGPEVYAGGDFRDLNNGGTVLNAADYVARWDGSNWSALGGTGVGNAALDGSVYALEAYGPNLYVGGNFHDVRGPTVLFAADHIARWDGANWSALGSNGAGNGSIGDPPLANVRAIAVTPSQAYVGGLFFNVNSNGSPLPYADYIASYELGSTIDVGVGGSPQGSYTLGAGTGRREGYAALNGGPVLVSSAAGSTIVASERFIYAAGSGSDHRSGTPTSYSELMGFPGNQLAQEYWFPWYNNVNMWSQLRFGNPSTTESTTVSVYLAGSLLGSYPLGPSVSTRVDFPGVNGGPLRLVSDEPFIGAERVIYSEGNGTVQNGNHTSYYELMGFPATWVASEYWIPWYNNVNMWSQLRFANPSATQSTTVNVYLGATLLGSYPLGPSTSTRVDYPGVNGGPLRIVGTSGVPLIAAERVIYSVGGVQNGTHTSYSELMAIPTAQVTSSYYFPSYSYPDSGTWSQVRFANPSTTLATTVKVYLAGALLGTYPLPAASSTRVDYIGQDSGPLQVITTDGRLLIAAMRVIQSAGGMQASYSEITGYPATRLTTSYWFPWYNNFNFDTQLRMAVP